MKWAATLPLLPRSKMMAIELISESNNLALMVATMRVSEPELVETMLQRRVMKAIEKDMSFME
jgi:hypothetical protein